jgi:hypothetical protein
MTMLVINCGPCVEYQLMINVVEILLTDFITLHMHTESHGNFRAPRPSVKIAKQNLGYGIFRA